MNQLNIDKIRKKVQKSQDDDRFEHTVGVMYTAAALAMRYGEDMERALTAGLLHDCAKGFSGEKKIKLCEKYGLPISDTERKNPGLLHAKLGAYLAEKEYDIEDTGILDAIICHTTGRPEMTLLDKILFIADYIEPNRNQAPNLDELRHLAFVDLDECLYAILAQQLGYLQSRKEAIDPMTEQTYSYYKKLMNK